MNTSSMILGIILIMVIGALDLINRMETQKRHEEIISQLLKINQEVNDVCSISTPMMQEILR